MKLLVGIVGGQKAGKPAMRDWSQASGVGIDIGAACLVDGIRMKIVTIKHQVVWCRPDPEIDRLIYAQLKPGQPYRLVGAACGAAAVRAFRKTWLWHPLPGIAVLPYRGGDPPRKLAGYQVRMLTAAGAGHVEMELMDHGHRTQKTTRHRSARR